MNVFLDTNVVLEYIFNRRYASAVEKILLRIRSGEIKGFISSGSLYTMTYLIEMNLKESGHKNPERVAELRKLLKSVVATFGITEIARSNYVDAIADESFKDIEDSYQYRHALAANCKVLLTINLKDYKGVQDDNQIEIITPTQFSKNYV